MRINRLSLRNYRCFEGIDLEFKSRVNIISGNNGSGITTILDAMSTILSIFTSSLNPRVKETRIKQRDIRTVLAGNEAVLAYCLPAEISMDLSIDGSNAIWKMIRRSKTGKNTVLGADKLLEYVKMCERGMGSEIVLPLVAYYSSHRPPVFRKRKSFHPKNFFVDGYRSSLKQDNINQWVPFWIEREAKRSIDDGETNHRYDVMKAIIFQTIGAIRNQSGSQTLFGHDVKSYFAWLDIMNPDKNGIRWLNELCEGERTAVSVALDMACRMSVLNPHLNENIMRETPGVVLVDEPEQHLSHLSCVKFIQCLANSFPKVQFIICSHVNKESLKRDAGGTENLFFTNINEI